MTNEIEESAKATKAIAEATSKALDVTEKLGGFLSKIIRQPMETAAGILDDKLKYVRWERASRLADRVYQLNRERGIEGFEKPVPLKLAIPAIENASIEEDNSLQDLWARLISSAQAGSSVVKVRSAYIDIIKQLEVSDVNLLRLIFNSYQEYLEDNEVPEELSPSQVSFSREQITAALGVSKTDYEITVDNLMRVRCICSEIIRTSGRSVGGINPSSHSGYEAVCITELGTNFVRACISEKI